MMGGMTLPRWLEALVAGPKLPITIALGEYSFNADFKTGKYNPLDLPARTREQFALGAIDYVSSFWAEKASDKRFLRELKVRASDHGIVNHLILVDIEGPQLGDLDPGRRRAAVEAHRPWLDVAAFLGCSGIRVNLSGLGLNGFGSPGNKKAVEESSVDGYRQLLNLATRHNLDVLVQNHVGYSCDPDWITQVMHQDSSKHAGILADPGHFQEMFYGPPTERGESFDLYAGWTKIVPYSKALNAKTHAFDDAGNETTIHYPRILDIARHAGYTGYIGIEWEPEGTGHRMSSDQGIKATKNLLTRCGCVAS